MGSRRRLFTGSKDRRSDFCLWYHGIRWSIALNVITLRFTLKKDLDKTGRGIMLATFVVMIVLFMFKVHLR